MTTTEKPLVVWHFTVMAPGWERIAEEQLDLFAAAELTELHLTHLGDHLETIRNMAARRGLTVHVEFTDPNTNLYELEALKFIQRTVHSDAWRNSTRPVLYTHSKGASAPHDESKRRWRQVMQEYVVRPWRQRVEDLKTHHAAGWAFWPAGNQHFTGNIWIASPVWLRLLPDIVEYHWKVWNGQRYSAEMWLGAGPTPIIAKCATQLSYPFWSDPGFDWTAWLPVPHLEPHRLQTMALSEILTAFGSDKDTAHSYGAIYDALYPTLESRQAVGSIVEIGVHHGRSLLGWQAAFPNAVIHGLDIKAPAALECTSRLHFHQGDATDPKFLATVAAKVGNMVDLIVDDGSHRFADQLASAVLMKSWLRPGGTYLIEDIAQQTSARLLSQLLGYWVLDRRGVKQRFDDLLVYQTPTAKRLELQALAVDVPADLPSPF